MSNYDKFKNRSRFRLEVVVVVILLLTVLLLFLFPRFDRESGLAQESKIIFVESIDIAPVELRTLNIPAPRPAIPVMSEDPDFDTEITLEDMDFDVYPDVNVPPPAPKGSKSDSVVFVPYDEAPEVIGSIVANIVYPEIAKEAGIEGTVIVQSYIDEKGIVQKGIIMKGMPGTGLDEAAMSAIKMTKFKPALQRDRAVGVWLAIPVTFKLNK